ncbi:MAG: hypothetical protein U5L95_05355 [Candidatus Saccharibacteria bacterium]|nr:hypothetical protein [Candidatus Saccharibacteria bacterium]
MPRLPVPGGDTGNWGDILNDYLSVSLASNGSLKPGIPQSKITNLTDDIADKYTKPSSGIPKSDLTSDVQTSLDSADSALQPGGGSPAANEYARFTGADTVEGRSAAQVRSDLNIEDGATADQTNAEIETAYNAQVSAASQAEAEAGTETADRRWSPLRVREAAASYTDDEVAALPALENSDDINVDDSVPTTLTLATKRAPRVFAGTSAYLLSTFNDDATETTLLNSTADIPANTLSLGDLVRITAIGTVTNNTGSNRDVTLRIKLEGTTLLTFAFTSLATSANGRTWTIDAIGTIYTLFGDGYSVGAKGLLGAAGGGVVDTNLLVAGNQTIDRGNELNFDITAQHSFASTDLTTTLRGFTVEQLPTPA